MLEFETVRECAEYVFKQKYFALCENFLKLCRAYKDLTYDQIPEAKAALRAIEEFENFSEKFFGIDCQNYQ